jgi:multiple sugar transport system ATP-binding protein
LASADEPPVHFDVDAPKVVTEDTKLLEQDSGAQGVPHHDDATRFVASFAPRSRVKLGDQIQIAVDTERIHFFDPSSGLAVRH